MNLGESIYKYRTEKNMSQGDLADALEVSRQSVSKWENNAAVPELEKLIKMAQLFDITLDELVGNSPPRSGTEPVHVPAPPSGITTGDLISVVLLILGIILPLIALFTASSLQSWFLLAVCLYITPAAVTLGAAYCSPNNKLLMRIYLGYDVIMCLLGLLSLLGAPQLAALTPLPTLGAYYYWSTRCEK